MALMESEENQGIETYPVLTQVLLEKRGITTREGAEKFLSPDWERDIFDPFLILNMEKAVMRILAAMQGGEKIVLYTDYDCDGIPAGVILHDFFKKAGYHNFENYIPHRHNEGYGMNIPAIETIAEGGAKLIITADLGIVDAEPVARANELGMEVIITDHHLPQEGRIPPAYAILDSKQEGDQYPDKMLCGAGLAWKLVQALLIRGNFEHVAPGWEKWLLDMAGLATIADMVPLKNENRALAHFGLKVLRKTRRKGLRLLLHKLRMNPEHLTEDDIGFMIAPRLNAAGRMDHPLRAFELLSTDDDAKAEELADFLNHLNDRRKGMVAGMMKDAKRRLRERELLEVIVIGHPEWEPGLLGLLAGNLAEEFSRPAFVWGRDTDGKIKGSCRTDKMVSVMELMSRAKAGTFLEFGGHSASGGFSVATDSVHTLEAELSEIYKNMEKDLQKPDIMADAELSFDDVNWNSYKEVERFAPFGMENPKPIFLFKDAEIISVKIFGKAKEHLELLFQKTNGQRIPAIGFFTTVDSYPGVLLGVGEKVNLLATMEKSMFRNYPELRLRMVDIVKNVGYIQF